MATKLATCSAMKARPAHFPFHSDFEKAVYHVKLALMQRFAGDLAGAKITAQQARNTLEPLYRDPTKQRYRR